MKNLKIGARLGVGFSVVLLLLTVLTAIGILRMNRASDMTDEMINVRMRNERLISEWFKVIEVNAVRATAAWQVADADAQKAFEANMAQSSVRATEIQDQMGKRLERADSKALYNDVLSARKTYLAIRKAVLKAKADGDLVTGKRLFENDMESSRKVYLEALRKLAENQQAILDEAAAEIHQEYRSGRTLLVTLGAAAIIMGIAFAWWITRTITQPINAAVKVAQTVSAGDLTSDIRVESDDETGQLMSALKDMNSNLVNIVGQVRSGSVTMTSVSNEIAAGNLDLSSRTEEQASSLQLTASSMEDLTSTVKLNAANARQANQLAISASEIASRGGAVVSEVVSTMGSINDSSRRIVEIISVIDSIAFQTNILALNAAVEAARAGEQGRGFAVVASEVRNLAQRSASAARDIKGLIDDSVQKVSVGSALVDRAGQTMDEIVQSIGRVTQIMNEITDASDAQHAGIEQVNRAIGEMDQVTQQNAALVEEAAAAAESMQQQSAQLAQVVSVFKLDAMASPRVATRPAAVVKPSTAPRPAAAVKQASAPAPKRIEAKVVATAAGNDGWEEF